MKVRKYFMIFVNCLSAALFSAIAFAQGGGVPFDSPRWKIVGGKAGEYLGRPAFMGTALLPDAAFGNGVIEFDVAATGARSYPGVAFRTMTDGSWERVYLRPHRAGATAVPLYPDVVQYVTAWNRADSWQLYNGDGFTAGAPIPLGRWFHVRLEVKGTQARVFLDGSETPALRIPHLLHGDRLGGLALMGPADGSAWFSRFSYRADDALSFAPAPLRDLPAGAVTRWEISQPFKLMQTDLEACPAGRLEWQPLVADDTGLVDISRLVPRSPGGPDLVYARTAVRAEKDGPRRFDLGYSDVVRVFVNGKLVYGGNSVYGSRDPSFLGILGYNDTLTLPLRQGENEVILAVGEFMGGWGLAFRDGEAVFAAPQLTRAWETAATFRMPESAAYDAARQAVYVSNFDAYNPGGEPGRQSISRLGVDGQVDRLDWVTGLQNPAGLCVVGDRLYAAEANCLAEIDIVGAKVARRVEIKDSVMLNDVCATKDGIIFISDPRAAAIFRLAGGQAETWLQDPRLGQANGLLVEGGRLLVLVNADSTLKSIDLATREMKTVAVFGPGLLDGLKSDGQGGFLVSQNEGRLYQVTADGRATKILDTSTAGGPIADFEYVPALHRLVVPQFYANRVSAWDWRK